MSALSISPPFPIFSDSDGTALENGYIWIGTTNLNPIVNPISVYWDAALTVAAVQPIRTLAGYPSNSGTPARLYVNSDYSIQVLDSNGSVVYSVPAATEAFGNLINASQVVYDPAGTGAVATTVQTKLRESVSVFDFMTAAQITAVQSYAFAVDMTTPVQAAMDAAWTMRADLFMPSGGYLVTGLTLPGTYPTLDQRDRSIRIYGQGYGNPYATSNTGGTVIKSVTNAPVFTDRVMGSADGQGTYQIDHIRFDGTSTTPVVLFNGFYGESSFFNCVIYQRSTGDGLKILYGGGGLISNVFAYNSTFVTIPLYSSRTGIGFNFPQAYDAGLMSFVKCSARGFLTGFSIGTGAAVTYNTKLSECEASVVYNGFILGTGARGCTISDCYLEGGEEGIGIQNLGNYNNIKHNLLFAGFSTGIQDTSTSNIGSNIECNSIGLGAVANAIGIDVQSSAVFGGYGKNVIGNTLVYTAGTNGVNGIKVSGTDPRINLIGNAFDPRSTWTGTSTLKINDASSNGVYGMTMKDTNAIEIPTLSRGAISFAQEAATLTQANVSGNILTIPDAGSFFTVSATGAATVLKFSSGSTSGRYVIFRTTTANMTFSNGAYVSMAGAASFTGPGQITFMLDRIGADNYAYEVSRTVF